jgi:hypothetical protein
LQQATAANNNNNYAIFDSGATDNFMIETADVGNKKKEHTPI